MEHTSTLAPYEQAAIMKRRRREAMKQGDRETAARLKRELINLYVSHGEDFKMAEQANPVEAKRYLREALKLAPKHPIANYRYAHLMYRDRQYAEAIRHFNRALDGEIESALNESQTMIAHIILVNCGVLIAKESLREVDDLQIYRHADLDKKLTDRYLDQMLLESDEMLQRFIYCRKAAGETTYISEAQFCESRKQPLLPNEAMICAAPEIREIRFGTSKPISLDVNAFYVLDTLLRAETPVQGKDLIDSLLASSLEIRISAEYMRQIFSRLHRKIPFWDDMIETDTTGNKTTRKLKEGITYTLMHHASVLTP